MRTSRQTGGLMTLTVRDLVNMAGTAFSPTADGLDEPEWGPSLSEHASFQQGMKETSLVCVSVYVV